MSERPPILGLVNKKFTLALINMFQELQETLCKQSNIINSTIYLSIYILNLDCDVKISLKSKLFEIGIH